jgi:hypothetical protein
VQLTAVPGTLPLLLAGLIEHVTVSTSVPGGCSTVITAEVNDRSWIVSVQLGFRASPLKLDQNGAVELGGGLQQAVRRHRGWPKGAP